MKRSMEVAREEEPSAERPAGKWRRQGENHSLTDVHRSIKIPKNASFWRRLLAFGGPGFLVAVGYMDPGNWATDISGGAMYEYRLLSVILLSNFIAILLQGFAAKLGIVTGRDLAQACRDAYSLPVAVFLWISAEIGIVACDIAEVLGAAIALNLLFHLPLILGILVTGLDVVFVLALQNRGFRWIEAIVTTLIGTIAVIFLWETVQSHPQLVPLFHGFIPSREIVHDPKQLYLALGILGATVMPHNLYMHSSIVQTRRHGHSPSEVREALRFTYLDTTVALMFALLVNAAILIVAAAAFYHHGHHDVGDIQSAYKLLTPILGVTLAAPMFAIALLASGQNATITGTIASQVILEGFLHRKLPPWVLRLVSRSLAIIPAVIAVAIYGERGTGMLLIFSQVVLSAQLAFAVIPLVQFTSDKSKMGEFVNSGFLKFLGWAVAALITGLNIYLVITTLWHH